jgi:hypothetical protein
LLLPAGTDSLDADVLTAASDNDRLLPTAGNDTIQLPDATRTESCYVEADDTLADGGEFDDLDFGSAMCGPAFKLRNTGGSPDVTVRRIYLNASGVPDTVPYLFAFQGASGLTLDQIETNNSALKQELFIDTCRGFAVRSYRSEAGTIDGASGGIITCSAAYGSIDGVNLLNKTWDVAGDAFAVRVSSTSVIDVRNVRAESITLSGGARLAAIENNSGGQIAYSGVTGFDAANFYIVYPLDSTPTYAIGFETRQLVIGRDVKFKRHSANVGGMDTGDHFKVDGTWNGGTIQLGAYYLWVDATGVLRIKSGAPASDTDGDVIGGQS